MPRTALIVDAPPSKTLCALRSKLAADARSGVPPHLTVLFPFVPAELFDASVSASLSGVVSRSPGFDFALTHTGWFGEDTLWLGPERPAPFRELTAAIVHAFPDYPPYAGRHDASVPHVTVADSGTADERRRAERTIESVLPLASTAEALTVLQESQDGRWHVRARLRFAPPR